MVWDGATTAPKDSDSVLVVPVVQDRREHVAVCPWRDRAEKVSAYCFAAIGEPGSRELISCPVQRMGQVKKRPRKCGH